MPNCACLRVGGKLRRFTACVWLEDGPFADELVKKNGPCATVTTKKCKPVGLRPLRYSWLSCTAAVQHVSWCSRRLDCGAVRLSVPDCLSACCGCRLEDLWLNDNQIPSLAGLGAALVGCHATLSTLYLENNPAVSPAAPLPGQARRYDWGNASSASRKSACCVKLVNPSRSEMQMWH
jgi:hypothetical protein